MLEERITAATDWAQTVLGPVQLHRLKLRPWAVTWLVKRPGERDLFLKCSTAQTGHEAAVLRVLTRASPDLVPELVAADPPGHRLIVASAGSVLRELRGDRPFDLTVWIPLVQRFARLQRSVMPYVDELLAQGVPDERPERLLDLLRSFTTTPQLPTAERQRLRALAERWEHEKASSPASLVPPSVQHGDLHDNNVAVDAEGRYRFFDFGDSSVAHPFSTMDLPLMFARDDSVDAAGIARLEDAYLDAFTDFAPLAELRRELHAVVAVAPLQRARNWLRALAPDEPARAHRATGLPTFWDPVAAAEWDNPVEYWLAALQ